MSPLQILFAGGNDPVSEDGALNWHVDLVKRVHDGLDPVFIDFDEEAADGFFGLRRRGVGCYDACSEGCGGGKSGRV